MNVCVQLICRLADQVDLPSRAELDAFYGGRAHLPQRPWGDYWCTTALGRKPYSRGVEWLRKGETEFRKRLAPDEVGAITAAMVRSVSGTDCACHDCTCKKQLSSGQTAHAVHQLFTCITLVPQRCCFASDGRTGSARVQVYVPMAPQPARDVLTPPDGPLRPKLVAFLDVLVHVMQQEWGGKDRSAYPTSSTL
jgi:hypothetical protein